LHPFNSQEELVRFLLNEKIVPVAYCPLGRPSASEQPKQEVDLKYIKVPDLRDDPFIKSLSKKYGKSEFQIALRWGVERGYAIIPKASQAVHQKENVDIFDFKLE